MRIHPPSPHSSFSVTPFPFLTSTWLWEDGHWYFIRHTLPDGWEESWDDDGASYFVDHNTGETTYDDPRTTFDDPRLVLSGWGLKL